MQKKIIALAIASVLSAPAFADTANINFYGIADVSYDMVDTGTATNGTEGASKRVVSSNVSRFGFKGSEALGDGLTAVWQIEQQINIDDSSNSCAAVAAGAAVPECKSNNGIFATRNTFAGLKGDFGTVLLGRHDTPYKISTRKLDVFGDHIADNRSLMGQGGQGFELRPTDVLAYISPAFAGVTAAIATVNLTESNTLDSQKSNSALSIAVMYDAAPFYGSVAHEQHKLDTVADGADESATRVGFGYTEEMFSVGVAYEKITDNQGVAQASKFDHNTVYVSGKLNLGSGAVKLAYTKLGEVASVADTGASQVSVGYDYSLSKRSTVYAMYTKLSNDQAAKYKLSQNSGASSTLAGTGASPSAISMGLKHVF
ncbi:MAG: porin [Sideroxyarcus sp.]|nr:porin [Sideroxyarcus sp.]